MAGVCRAMVVAITVLAGCGRNAGPGAAPAGGGQPDGENPAASGIEPPARFEGGQTGQTPTLVPTPAGEEVLIGQHPIGANLPAGMYTCARCHMVPSPEVLPRDRWPGALTRMNDLIRGYSLGEPLSQAELARVIEYYTSRASMGLPMLPVETAPAGRDAVCSWEQAPLGLQTPMQPGAPMGPVIAGVTVVDLDRNGAADVLLSDAANNAVTWIHRGEQGWLEQGLARLTAPSRTSVLDVEGDGDLDVAVAVLGSLQPTDNLTGSFVLLINNGASEFTPVTILKDEPRACDIRPADLDGDGDVDFAFASFGLFHTGRAGWLEQTGPMQFTPHELLRSSGVSHAPAGDVNGDGRPDIVVLVSQEHEKVMLYLNVGAGRAEDGGAVRFAEHMLWRAPHPMWGNSSADLIDLDQDGDLDVLFTNGDALDNEPYAKPWHGVQWLENRSEGGTISFEYHKIGGFHGAYWADAADFDLDGDLDVIVTSMMNQWQDARRQAVVWFENDGEQMFTMWPISNGPTYQVVGDVGDLDGDGRPDVVTGGMYVYPPFVRVSRAQVFVPRPPRPAPPGGAPTSP